MEYVQYTMAYSIAYETLGKNALSQTKRKNRDKFVHPTEKFFRLRNNLPILTEMNANSSKFSNIVKFVNLSNGKWLS